MGLGWGGAWLVVSVCRVLRVAAVADVVPCCFAWAVLCRAWCTGPFKFEA